MEQAAAAQVVAPVIPASHPGRTGNWTGAAGRRPLPLADPDHASPPPLGVVYGMCRTDSSGRVTDHTLTDALGWAPGDRLTITSAAHAVLVHRDPDGPVSLPGKACITIPAALRRRHHIQTGDRLLVAATPEDDLLAIYPLATVHNALTTLTRQHAGGDPQ